MNIFKNPSWLQFTVMLYTFAVTAVGSFYAGTFIQLAFDLYNLELLSVLVSMASFTTAFMILYGLIVMWINVANYWKTRNE